MVPIGQLALLGAAAAATATITAATATATGAGAGAGDATTDQPPLFDDPATRAGATVSGE